MLYPAKCRLEANFPVSINSRVTASYHCTCIHIFKMFQLGKEGENNCSHANVVDITGHFRCNILYYNYAKFIFFRITQFVSLFIILVHLFIFV